jgi:hypothetical protein
MANSYHTSAAVDILGVSTSSDVDIAHESAVEKKVTRCVLKLVDEHDREHMLAERLEEPEVQKTRVGVSGESRNHNLQKSSESELLEAKLYDWMTNNGVKFGITTSVRNIKVKVGCHADRYMAIIQIKHSTELPLITGDSEMSLVGFLEELFGNKAGDVTVACHNKVMFPYSIIKKPSRPAVILFRYVPKEKIKYCGLFKGERPSCDIAFNQLSTFWGDPADDKPPEEDKVMPLYPRRIWGASLFGFALLIMGAAFGLVKAVVETSSREWILGSTGSISLALIILFIVQDEAIKFKKQL